MLFINKKDFILPKGITKLKKKSETKTKQKNTSRRKIRAM